MKDNRRKRLQALLDGPRFNGDRSAFLSASELTKGRLSQLLDKNEVFGELAGKNLATKLGLDERYFEVSADQNDKNNGNVDAARAFAGEVPVISWVQAGNWNEAADPFQPGEAERYLPIFRGHSSSTFALKVRGDSMTAPYGKSYPEGSYIIVDPAKLSPSNGDRIIAKLEGTDEVTFKVYKDEDGRKWLAPLNSTHQPIIQPFKILGTVIGKWEDE